MRDGEAWGKGMVISPAAKTREGFLEEGPFLLNLNGREFWPRRDRVGKMMSQKGLGSKQVTWEDAPESESSPIFLPFLKDGGWLPPSWSEVLANKR